MITFYILFLICYSLATFLISNVWILLCFTLFNILLCLNFRVNLKKLIKNLIRILPFACIVFIFNYIFDGLIPSLIIVWKIYIVTNFCFIFSASVSPSEMAAGFAGLFAPLKIFKVNTWYLSIMFVIIFNFIPIMRKYFVNVKRAMKARRAKLSIKNLFSVFWSTFAVYFVSIFKMADDIEKTLLIRGVKE